MYVFSPVELLLLLLLSYILEDRNWNIFEKGRIF